MQEYHSDGETSSSSSSGASSSSSRRQKRHKPSKGRSRRETQQQGGGILDRLYTAAMWTRRPSSPDYLPVHQSRSHTAHQHSSNNGEGGSRQPYRDEQHSGMIMNEKALYYQSQYSQSLCASTSSASCAPPPSLLRACTPASSAGPKQRSTWCVLLHLVQLAILVLALVGLGAIVAFATGLLQRTPIYSEKALQDSGWTRRPITIGSRSSTRQSAALSQRPNSGVTIHDFTPSLPPLIRGEHQTPLSSSASSTSTLSSVPSNELHLLILCPLRNAASDLPHFFSLLDNITHPFSNTSLGFLVGDEDDETGNVLHDLVAERMKDERRRYRHVSLLHKDFKVEMPSGSNRHSYLLQSQRRTVMARARTYLLTATLEPTVDWVLWLDSDIGEFSPSLFEDLLIYGNAGVLPSSQHASSSSSSSRKSASASKSEAEEWNDVIVPNAMKRLPDGSLQGFDMNNWSETPESQKLRLQLSKDDLLIEGNIWQHMHRMHLADNYTSYLTPALSPSSASSPSSPATSPSSSTTSSSYASNPSAYPQLFSSHHTLSPTDQRLNASSPAYIGKLMPLDGIGGVAALVRAEVHRMGATFPAWVFENQLETEAFGVLAKKLGARVVGLPNMFVLHST